MSKAETMHDLQERQVRATEAMVEVLGGMPEAQAEHWRLAAEVKRQELERLTLSRVADERVYLERFGADGLSEMLAEMRARVSELVNAPREPTDG